MNMDQKSTATHKPLAVMEKMSPRMWREFSESLRLEDMDKMYPVTPSPWAVSQRVAAWQNAQYIRGFVRGNKMVAVVVLFETWRGKWSLAFSASNEFHRGDGYYLAKYMREKIKADMIKKNARVIEANSPAWAKDAHRLMKFVGLQKIADLPKEGIGGVDYELYRWVNPQCAPE